MDKISDIIIIGGGPSGLYGAFYSGIRTMSCTILDSLPQLGGQLSALYPKKYIYDVPGHTKVLAEDLVKELVEQAGQFNPDVHLSEKVIQLDNHPDRPGILSLTTEKGNVFLGKSVVIAAGAGAFLPRKLDVSRVDELENRGLYYHISNPNDFKDKEVLIVGGGDSALDWAMMLESIARKVTLIHRSDKFRAHEDSVNKLMDSSVDVKLSHEVKLFEGEDNIKAVVIFDNQSGEELNLPVEKVISSLGFVTNLGPIKEWGFDLNKNAIQVTQTMNTNIEGVWAAGDIVSYRGKLKLISTGFAEAAVAVNMAKNFIDPKAKVFPGHSSGKPDSFKF